MDLTTLSLISSPIQRWVIFNGTARYNTVEEEGGVQEIEGPQPEFGPRWQSPQS